MKPYRRKSYNSRLSKKIAAQSLEEIRFLLVEFVKFFNNKKTQKYLIYLLGILCLSWMLLWNWAMVLATMAGVGVMILVYLLQTCGLSWSFGKSLLSGLNYKLVMSVLSGGVAALSTYLATAIWADSESRWLALGSILQGFGTLMVISLLGWQLLDKNKNSSVQDKWEAYLADLTHSDPLKRLIAIHSLAKSSSLSHPLEDYYRLMLQQEKDPLVKDALLEVLAQSEQPLKIPLKVPQRTLG